MLTQGAPKTTTWSSSPTSEVFGDYLLFRTAEPRPVAGTQGLVAVAWHRSFEEYAGTQMQNRFEKKPGRIMTERDYTAGSPCASSARPSSRTGHTMPTLRAYILLRQISRWRASRARA